MWHIYDCDYLQYTTFCFYLINFSVKYRFPFPILCFLPKKSPNVTQGLVSQENAFKKSKNLLPFFFFCKTIGSNNSFTLIETISEF